MAGTMDKLKKRWGVTTNLQLIIIFVVFAITGSSAVYLARPFLDFVGLDRTDFHESIWGAILYRLIRLLVIFPIYQVLLIVYGWLFGQFRFFWAFEKKMLRTMGLGFLLKNRG